jgi:hypothetical protein
MPQCILKHHNNKGKKQILTNYDKEYLSQEWKFDLTYNALIFGINAVEENKCHPKICKNYLIQNAFKSITSNELDIRDLSSPKNSIYKNLKSHHFTIIGPGISLRSQKYRDA